MTLLFIVRKLAYLAILSQCVQQHPIHQHEWCIIVRELPATNLPEIAIYLHAYTAVFFSTLASWAVSVTGIVWFPDPSCMGGARKAFLTPPIQEGSRNQTNWPAHQYISTIHFCSVEWDFAKKVPSLSAADLLQAVSLHLQMHLPLAPENMPPSSQRSPPSLTPVFLHRYIFLV